jgi:putative cell wall-binding protein
MNATQKEKECQNIFKCLRTAFNLKNKTVPAWVVNGADNMYGDLERLNEAVKKLCEMCPTIDEDKIYDGRNKEARKLVDWWEEHQEADKKRMLAEQSEEIKAKQKEDLIKSAKSKLNKAEIKALGI